MAPAFRYLLLVLFAVLALSACGIKGPLVEPGQTPKHDTHPAPARSQPESTSPRPEAAR